MAKRIKMLLYGEPGVGKSVFALHAPKPFFICTDGNYEWLDEFGADPNAHKNVSSWVEMKEALESNFDGYETVVVDLLEDGFKWCEQEYCIRNKIEHVSDVGYGKAYDTTRNEFFIAISKLLSMDKHVILICHGITFTTKDRRGVEHTRYAPSNRIPDKVLDMIEGRVRYCLRCYVAAHEESDGTIVKRRYLSLVPKENEFGIIRGVDENTIPHDIPLDFTEFAKHIKLNVDTITNNDVSVKNVANTATQASELAVIKVDTAKPKKAVIRKVKSEVTEETPADKKIDVIDNIELNNIVKSESVDEVIESTDEITELTNEPIEIEDKLAALKAKLAALKAKNN